MVQSDKKVSSMSDVRINMHEASFAGQELAPDMAYAATTASTTTTTTTTTTNTLHEQAVSAGGVEGPTCWHIPRPSLVPQVGRSEKSNSISSNSIGNGTWKEHAKHPEHSSPSRGSTASQGSNASTHSAASGTLLLTAANLANLAAMHPPCITAPKQLDEASVASSTHFTMVNGLGRPSNYRKSWCARNQLTVLVCTMSFLFMLGLLAGVLYMDVRAKSRYN